MKGTTIMSKPTVTQHPSTIAGWFDPTTDEFHQVPIGDAHLYSQVLAADRSGNTPDGQPTFNVFSDELGLLGNFVGGVGSNRESAIEALAQASGILV